MREREQLPVLMEIPFDRKIAEAYSCGRLFAEEMPEWKDRFREMFQQITTAVLENKERRLAQ